MEIKKAKKEDCKNVYSLVSVLKETLDYNKFKESFDNNIGKDDVFYYILWENNNPIGFISVVINYQLHHADKVATIEELVINKQYQGKNYGTMLLNYGVQLAKNQKCDVIELTSNFTRENAHRFYEKNGFKKTSYKFKMNLNS